MGETGQGTCDYRDCWGTPAVVRHRTVTGYLRFCERHEPASDTRVAVTAPREQWNGTQWVSAPSRAPTR